MADAGICVGLGGASGMMLSTVCVADAGIFVALGGIEGYMTEGIRSGISSKNVKDGDVAGWVEP